MSGECDKCGEHAVECKCHGCDMAKQLTSNLFYLEQNVNHPPHYQGSKMEVIDIIEDFNLDFCLGNAVKYILRAGKKGDRLEDLNKAIWYLERECWRHIHGMLNDEQK